MYKLLKGFLAVFEMAVSTYDWVKASSYRDSILTYLMTKPRTQAEMQKHIGVKGVRLSPLIKVMLEKKIFKKLGAGIYGLARQGEIDRKGLVSRIDGAYGYTELPGVHWGHYAWVHKGSTRGKLLQVMGREPQRATEIIRKAKLHGRTIEDQTQGRKNPVSRRTYSTLHDFVGRGLAARVMKRKHAVFKLEDIGYVVRRQYSLP